MRKLPSQMMHPDLDLMLRYQPKLTRMKALRITAAGGGWRLEAIRSPAELIAAQQPSVADT
jgi:hypothetical protein